VSDVVIDASLALRWFLDDEKDRDYSLSILASLSKNRAVVPMLWFYEVGNGLVMAYRRKRVTLDQVQGFLQRVKALPISAAEYTSAEVLEIPAVAQLHNLTNYDAAYLALSIRLRLPLATTDAELRRAASAAGVGVATG
jgi:predicted nucleic acid-binding protein